MRQPIDMTARRRSIDGVALGVSGESLVMMVDDEPLVIELVQAFLESTGYKRFLGIADSANAIGIMQRERPQVVLLDISMPDISGFDILKWMRADPLLQHIPVIVLTSADDPDTKLKALELGASDFLRKPVDPSELALRLRNTLAAKAYQDYLLFYDRSTGLANRHRFIDELGRALIAAAEEKKMGAMLQVGLDRFKQINEVLGPATGDLVLKEAGRRIRATLSRFTKSADKGLLGGVAARVGGDEFSVVLPAIPAVEHAARIAEALLPALALPYEVGGKDLHVTSSIGVALFPADGNDIDDIVRNAAAALHEAKKAGRDTYRFYSREFYAKAAQRLSVEAELRQALERAELRLFYQPKFSIATNMVCGAEALLRWQHPTRGLLLPANFISIAEESGLIMPIGDWAIYAACGQLRAWREEGLCQVPIAVNVSARQFRPQLVQTIRQAIAAGAPPNLLQLELTESSLMSDPAAAIELLSELKALGMEIAIDDFGTGYSSLSYLQKLPLDELKIDHSFIDVMRHDGSTAVLVDLIIAMAHGLSLRVVAEGVEKAEQLDYLRKRGCDECQGSYFSEPVSAQEFAARFLRRT